MSALGALCLLIWSVAWFSADAEAAPTTFALAPVTDANGARICDASGDQSPTHADIGCNGDGASAYFGSTSTLLGAGFVLSDSPTTTVGQQPPIHSTTYVVQLGVNGVHTASFGVDGKGTNDTDHLYAGCAGAAAPAYTVPASTALAQGTLAVAPDTGGTWRMTFNVPLGALSGCGITSATALTPFFGTSQAGPLDNVNKDYFLGSSVSFGAVNTAPVALPDTDSRTAGTGAATIAILANDTDADGDPLTIVAVDTTGLLGTLTVAADNKTVSYTPPATLAADTTTTFAYTVTDGKGGTDSTTVAITLLAPAVQNTPPVANADATTRTAGTGAAGIVVLANDTDANGDALTIDSVGVAGLLGSLTVAADKKSLSYTPPATLAASTTTAFTYVVSDGKGGTDDTTVTITLTVPTGVNTAPVAIDDSASTAHGTPVPIGVLVNDSDPDGDALTVAGVTGPAHGVLSLAGGIATYTPDSGFSGTDSFTYLVSDGNGGTDTALVTVTVAAPASSPTPTASSSPTATASASPTADASPTASASPTAGSSPTVDPSPTSTATTEPSPIGGTTSPDPATGGTSPSPSAEPSPTDGTTAPDPATGGEASPSPTTDSTDTTEQPTTLPFTGGHADMLLGLGAGLSVIGLLLALTGRRRRLVE